MRYSHILPVACLCPASVTTSMSAAMSSMPAPAMPSAFKAIADRQMVEAVNNVRLHFKPTTQSTQLATLKSGTKVDVLELVDHGKWAHVKVVGKTGYISANLLQ